MANVKAVRANNFYDAGLCMPVPLTTCGEFDYENIVTDLLKSLLSNGLTNTQRPNTQQ
jgi:hypothetical protein